MDHNSDMEVLTAPVRSWGMRGGSLCYRHAERGKVTITHQAYCCAIISKSLLKYPSRAQEQRNVTVELRTALLGR